MEGQRSMKRFMSIVVALAVAAGVLLVTTGASIGFGTKVYPPIPGCQSVDIPTNYNPGWITWTGGGHRYGTFRVSRDCGLRINYHGDGLRFNNSACVLVRVEVMGDDWVVDKVTPAVTVCGNSSAQVAGFPILTSNSRFSLLIAASSAGSRHPVDWADGDFIF